jgi:hypothetical protein
VTVPATVPATDELDRQIDLLTALGYAELAGITREEFRARLAPLRATAAGLADLDEPTDETVPLVLVVTRQLVAPAARMPLTHLAGTDRPGVVDRNYTEADLATYQPIEGVVLPAPAAYLLLDVHRGSEFSGVRPEDALPTILGRGRTPLTIDEGISLVTAHPQVLASNRCFMLSGSRRGDRRVPAMWISRFAPKLGWCWDGNPHSWLGVASAGSRVA